MSKIAVVYWSGTGNTEAMARAVLEGAQAQGAQGVLLTAPDFDESMIASFDAIAFGCPSMGVEVLEETEFEPMFSSSKNKLAGKRVALFGSYGWGDGSWMQTWEQTCKDCGISPVCDSVICNDAPDTNALAACKALGAALLG